MPSPYLIIAIAAGIIAGLIINHYKYSKNNNMKIYALVYQYKTKNVDDIEHDMTLLTHIIDESLENVMQPVEEEIKKKEGYVPYSMKLSLKKIMSLDDVLDNIKIKLPELVQSAKQREKLTEVAKILNNYENQS